MKRESHLVTFSSGGNRTQVDYILYRRNFRKNVTNVKVIPGEEVAQQLFLLVCDFRVCLPSLRERKFVPRLRTWKLRDQAVAEQFEITFKSKVEATVAISGKSSGESPVESAWSKLKSPLLETAKEVCGLSSKHAWRKET